MPAFSFSNSRARKISVLVVLCWSLKASLLHAETVAPANTTEKPCGEPIVQEALPASANDIQRQLHETMGGFYACVRRGKYDLAMALAQAAKQLAAESGAPADKARSLNAEAVVYAYYGNYAAAIERFRESRELYEKIGDKVRAGYLLNNIAYNLNRLGQHQQALETYQLAQQHFGETEDKVSQAVILSGFGTSYLAMGKTEQAYQAALSCVRLAEELNDPLWHAECSILLANSNLALARFADAFAVSERALQRSANTNTHNALPGLYAVAAKAKIGLTQFEAARVLAKESLQQARTLADKGAERVALTMLTELAEKTGDINAELAALRSKEKLVDEIYTADLARLVSSLKVQLEFEAKEREIDLLRRQNVLQQASAEAAKAQRTAAIAISLCVLALFAIGYGRWMHNRDLKRAEAANQKLTRLNELKDQFLANTSHELRTPLNGIIGLTDLVLMDEAEKLSAEAQDNLRMVRDCGMQLSQQVDDILDFSRLKADKLALQLQPVRSDQAVEEVVRLLRPLAISKGLALHSAVPSDMPLVRADADRIKQVLNNLIGNAIKFTEAGSVVVSADREGEQLRIHIKDSGIGIPHDRQGRIFEPFEQADGSAGRRFGGAGLGLAIARQLVVEHQGTLSVISEPGRGSVFSFTLPLA